MVERTLGLALNSYDDGQIDLLLFGTNAYQLPAVTLEEIDGYVERVILSSYKIREATKYAPPLRMLWNKYKGPQKFPVLVIFLTDGGNSDKGDTNEIIREMSGHPIFVQLVGIRKEEFPYLNELPGRVLDNAGFMQVQDIDSIKDAQLYNQLLNEFPKWLVQVKQRGLIPR